MQVNILPKDISAVSVSLKYFSPFFKWYHDLMDMSADYTSLVVRHVNEGFKHVTVTRLNLENK